jgi:hypothetical protein
LEQAFTASQSRSLQSQVVHLEPKHADASGMSEEHRRSRGALCRIRIVVKDGGSPGVQAPPIAAILGRPNFGQTVANLAASIADGRVRYSPMS